MCEGVVLQNLDQMFSEVFKYPLNIFLIFFLN